MKQKFLTDTSVQAPQHKRGPWPFLAAGFLLLHATGMFFAVRAAVSGGGAREVREPVNLVLPESAESGELSSSEEAAQ